MSWKLLKWIKNFRLSSKKNWRNSNALRRFLPVNIRRFSIFSGCNVYIQFYFLNINNSSQLFAHESVCKNGRDVSYFNVEENNNKWTSDSQHMMKWIPIWKLSIYWMNWMSLLQKWFNEFEQRDNRVVCLPGKRYQCIWLALFPTDHWDFECDEGVRLSQFTLRSSRFVILNWHIFTAMASRKNR